MFQFPDDWVTILLKPIHISVILGFSFGSMLVLDGLFRNAYQYRREDQKGKVTIRGKLEGENLRIWVNDNGVGINPEVLPKVFDLFFRGNTRSKGLGIGLYLARGIMDQLGGQLELYSDEKGSTATILLPDVCV